MRHHLQFLSLVHIQVRTNDKMSQLRDDKYSV